MPSFTDSSAATRACPQVGFSNAMRTMSLRMFPGSRGPSSSRFPFPEQLETCAMPTNESLRLDDDQGTLPIEEPRPEYQRETGGVVQSSGLRLAFFIEGELFS